MPRDSIIRIASLAGVEMRRNKLLLGYDKAAFARNIAFSEGDVKTRPGIRYHNLGIKGQNWQGGCSFSPSEGLSAMNYASTPDGVVNVVDGEVYVNPIIDNSPAGATQLGNIGSAKTKAYPFDAENYLIVLSDKTHYSNGGSRLTCSRGLDENGECYTETHDTLCLEDAKNHVPHGGYLGEYVHGRTHVALPFSCSNSEVAVSDLISKRGCIASDDLLIFEEHCNPSHGGGLTAPSRLGPAVAMSVMPATENDGEGELFVFHRNGVVRHNTMMPGRESRFDAEGTQLSEGWDTRRLTNVVLNRIGATGRYSVYQLPNDIFFRSKYGLHFLKMTLGQGTLNDETTNLISHDLEPLLKAEGDLENATLGHWIDGDRFFATVGDNTSFVSFNQTYTFTEDRTPRFVAEGLWKPDSGIKKIHKFLEVGGIFGFICSDFNDQFYFGEFDNSLEKGVDLRDDVEYIIRWRFDTGAFALDGFENLKEIQNGYFDAIISGGNITSLVRTDQHSCWEKWANVDCDGDLLLNGYEFNQPSKPVREATWFQFRLDGEGYVNIRTLDLEYSKTTKKSEGKGKCVDICSEEDDYFGV